MYLNTTHIIIKNKIEATILVTTLFSCVGTLFLYSSKDFTLSCILGG